MVHCMKSVRIQSYSGSYFPAFGLNTVHIQSECGKILTRITPNTDTFYAVVGVRISVITGRKWLVHEVH